MDSDNDGVYSYTAKLWYQKRYFVVSGIDLDHPIRISLPFRVSFVVIPHPRTHLDPWSTDIGSVGLAPISLSCFCVDLDCSPCCGFPKADEAVSLYWYPCEVGRHLFRSTEFPNPLPLTTPTHDRKKTLKPSQQFVFHFFYLSLSVDIRFLFWQFRFWGQSLIRVCGRDSGPL